MQIDFHHTVTYILARLAGFEHPAADIIAQSAQYVDDAVYAKTVFFDNASIYQPMLSAHKILDYRNFNALSNHLVWVPFHFLPANCGRSAGESTGEEFAARLTCRPGSPLAEDMIKECIRQKQAPGSLYRLGIALHTYADSWAHQGFSGIQHYTNRVTYLDDDETSKLLFAKVLDYFSDRIVNKAARTISQVAPLGHGAVLSFPDLPYLRWHYIDYAGRRVERDNPAIFVDAANHMFMALQRFRAGKPDKDVPSLPHKDAQLLYKLFLEIDDLDKNIRHQKWLDLIANGILGLPPIKISYHGGKWESAAFGGAKIDDVLKYNAPYSDAFMHSHWKKFNDAAKDQHYFLICQLFPRYNLLVA